MAVTLAQSGQGSVKDHRNFICVFPQKNGSSGTRENAFSLFTPLVYLNMLFANSLLYTYLIRKERLGSKKRIIGHFLFK